MKNKNNNRGKSIGYFQSKKNNDLNNQEELNKKKEYYDYEKIEKLVDFCIVKVNNFEKKRDDKYNYLVKRMNDYDHKIEELRKYFEKDKNKNNELAYLYESNNNKQEYENYNLEKELVYEYKYKFRGKSLKNFIINKYRIEEFGYQYFTPLEIEKENEMINTFIKEKLYDYMPENEKIYNETVANFVYSIGGISRIAQKIAKKLYNELFEEFKKIIYLSNDNQNYNNEEIRKKFSIWTKKCINGNEIYEYYSYLNMKEINKYLYKKDNKTNQILFKLYQAFISLYLKCHLSFPIVEALYTKDNCDYNPKYMFDDFSKKGAKNKKVNFCYIPALISNNRFVNNAKYYVFTYIQGKSFHFEENVYNHITNK